MAAVSAVEPAFAAEYRGALLRYLDGTPESGLEQAYELGRKAMNAGMGILEMAELQTILMASVAGSPPGEEKIQAAGRFFQESLSSYEMTHRAFREANSALRHLNELLEEQAKRIAHALHDDAAQLLVSVHLGLEELGMDLQPAQRGQLQDLREILDKIEERLRQFSHELRPMMLDDLGLLPALRFLGQSVGKRSGLSVSVESSLAERLPPALETALYRIFQEMLNNAAKHSRAKEVRIDLRREGNQIQASVRDDGKGFDPEAESRIRRGLGLMGIRERVEALRGTISIQSAPGEGAHVRVTLPMRS
jgi:two-component system sensor histidine kinase DegS